MIVLKALEKELRIREQLGFKSYKIPLIIAELKKAEKNKARVIELIRILVVKKQKDKVFEAQNNIKESLEKLLKSSVPRENYRDQIKGFLSKYYEDINDVK